MIPVSFLAFFVAVIIYLARIITSVQTNFFLKNIYIIIIIKVKGVIVIVRAFGLWHFSILSRAYQSSDAWVTTTW